jgi:hypothetical protein
MKVVANTTVVANFIPHGTGGTGTILREFWLSAAGSTTADLTANPNFPNNPSGSSQLTTLEGPTNFGDAYGTRIRGFIHPPVSGAYTFWLASDDGGDLFLSTSADPASATRIAFVDTFTNPHEYTKLASQKSVSINLVAGQKYYIEVLQKEGGGGDNVSVAWQGPGLPQAIIPGIYMSPFVPTGGGTTRTLTVTKAGTGTGTVTSSPAGINCGTTCSASFASGASVTLTAAAASGSTFAGWTGACTGTSTCTVAMTAAQSVTATFNTAGTTNQTLTVTKAGTGAGTVTSSPAGISCGATCSASFASGTSVTLTAAAASGSTFAGWSGACTGTGTCTVSMTAARTVTATFTASVVTGAPCANPITFTSNTGNFNTTGPVCYRTSAVVNGWGCSSFDGRTVSVGGQPSTSTCGQMPVTRSADGFVYFSATAGAFPWATFFTW